jgi:hypothetical protein
MVAPCCGVSRTMDRGGLVGVGAAGWVGVAAGGGEGCAVGGWVGCVVVGWDIVCVGVELGAWAVEAVGLGTAAGPQAARRNNTRTTVPILRVIFPGLHLLELKISRILSSL